jgi:hypothetical protein
LNKHSPIVVFELTADPISPVSIKDQEGHAALLPEKYQILVFGETSDRSTGAYFLDPIDGIVRFDKAEQYDLVAYPAKRKIAIARQGPRHEAARVTIAN